MVNFSIYFILQFTSLRFVFSEGEDVRIPATSYLVPLFTLIYLVLFHLLLPSYLDVPCYLNNRQRYCSVWPERDWTLYTFLNNLFLPLGEIYCLSSFYLCIGWMEALGFHLFLAAHIL